jgi:high-affinity nickel-transport protein
MTLQSTDWPSLLALAFSLGLKHGLDPDHLATIDGLTRYNSLAQRPVARYCGSLFSLGHGAIVVVMALGVSVSAGQWQVPTWMDGLGSGISIFFLLVLGALNLRAVLITPAYGVVRPAGWKGRWLGPLAQASNPLAVAGVGALFALSFDTLSQAAFFALSTQDAGGWRQALSLSLLFVLGMLVTDGINGLWVAKLIARADRKARVASRIMGLAVAGLSLSVGFLGLARMGWPSLSDWAQDNNLWLGLLSVVLLASAFALVTIWLNRERAAP